MQGQRDTDDDTTNRLEAWQETQDKTHRGLTLGWRRAKPVLRGRIPPADIPDCGN
jgi:hypothetical protein